MNFLTEQDFRKIIRQEHLNIVIDNDPTFLDDMELAARVEMESYLRQRYDVATELSQTGAERNPILVLYLTDMLLYHLMSRIDATKITPIRMDRYDHAIKWLTAVRDGKIDPGLKPLPAKDPSDYGRAFNGGNNIPNRNSQY